MAGGTFHNITSLENLALAVEDQCGETLVEWPEY